MTPRLRPCPFCGSLDVALHEGQVVGARPDDGHRFARCCGCGASTRRLPMAEAVKAWNRRVSNPLDGGAADS